MAKQEQSLLGRVGENGLLRIETGGFSVAETVSVCSDSNHNQTATTRKRKQQNRRQKNA
jgi:hypothetical protein